MTGLKEWLDRRKVRPAAWPKNMAVLYLLCIIVPLLATDTIFFALLITSGRSDRQYSYEKAAENIAYQFTNILDDASNIVMNVTKNDEFEEFLETNYESDLEYFEAYNRVTNNKFLKALCSINDSSLMIFTDNPTIINGGGIYNLNKVSEYEWYKEFSKSDQDTGVKFIYDKDTSPISKPRRRFMFIRRMNYFPRGRYRKICIVSMDYGVLARNLESSLTGVEGYIADDEDAYVFTAGNNNVWDDYTPVSSIGRKVGYSCAFAYSGNDLNINVFEEEGSGLETIRKRWPLFLIMLIVNAVLPVFFAKLTQTVQLGKLKEQEMDIARQQAELLALHSQINPHFLFNALESIRMHSVIRGEDETAEMVEKLAVIERKNADWNEDHITIANEMDFVDAYLKLQQYRFGDRLSYEIDIEDGCEKRLIPRLTIVTFVENACVHGIEGKSSPGWIFVRVYRKDGDLVIEIEDTGEGISDEDMKILRSKMEDASIDDLKHKGRIGVVNACLRLKIATEGNVRFEAESEKNIGTTITVIIPGEYVNEKSIAG